MEGGEDGLVDLLGVPVTASCAAVEKDFEQRDDTWVVELDGRVINRAKRGARDRLDPERRIYL